jgi:hypothetical protein
MKILKAPIVLLFAGARSLATAAVVTCDFFVEHQSIATRNPGTQMKHRQAPAASCSITEWRKNRFARHSAIAAMLAILLAPVTASATAILSAPTANYLASTLPVTFSDTDETLIGSASGGGLTIQFSSLMRASTVGDNWASWGSPPDTESATPRVLWSGLDDDFLPVTAITFLLSSAVSVFGFEAEPGPTDFHTLTASFSSKGVLQQSISQTVNGNAGARLFAVSARPGELIDSITVTSDADWAAGQFRFAAPTAIAEPSSLSMVLIGLGALLAIFRNRRV